MSPTIIMIVGADTDFGGELVKICLEEFQPSKIIATYRGEDQSGNIMELAALYPQIVVPIMLDVRDHSKYEEVVRNVEEATDGAGLNLLINNAGIFLAKPMNLLLTTKTDMLHHFEVNTVAPLLLSKALLPLLRRGARQSSAPLGVRKAAIVNISSFRASISQGYGMSHCSYAASKAALNMITKSLSIDLIQDGIIAVALYPPGHTDYGGGAALFEIQFYNCQISKTLTTLNESHNGKFVSFEGEVSDW